MAWIAGGILCALLAGCGKGKPSAAVEQARALLPLGKPQEALDQLASDTSAEGQYLKAVALWNLQLYEAVRDQLQKAIAADPDNPKYRAYRLRLQVLQEKDQGKRKAAADELLKIYEQNKSAAAIAFFAAAGFAEKGDAGKALEAFQTSIALSDEAPEFLPEMLIYAMKARLGAEAKGVLEKLEKLSPGDPFVAKQRVAVLIMVNDHEGAIHAAESLYEAEKQSLDSALLYARALTAAPPTPGHDRAVEKILAVYPRNEEIVAMYAVYLTQSDRLGKALELLNPSIAGQPALARQKLIHMAIDLPLKAREADVAEKQIQRFKPQITPPVLATYYEGRLLYLREDYAGAAARFAQVLEAGKTNDPAKRAIAIEAAGWLRQVQFDQRVTERLRKLAEEVTGEGEKEGEAKRGPSVK